MSELLEIFREGDAELRATAGEDALLVRWRSGERVRVRAVVSPAETQYALQDASGALIACDRTVLLSRSELTRKPDIGDRLEVGGDVYRVERVTGWAFDTSWHVDVKVLKQG